MAEKPRQSFAPTESSEQLEQLYTIREGRDRLHVGNTKIWELIREGHLEIVRLGGRCTRIKGASINRLIQHGIRR